VEPNYHVQAGSGLVETWSTQQLSYDPHDWRRTWRDELKVELLSLGRDGTGNRSFLAARFESPVRDYACDAENVLFYNLSGAFAASTRDGLRFERLYSTPPASPVALSGPAIHYHHYAFSQPGVAFHGWRETSLLAQFDGIELPWLKFDSSPALVWFPMREAAIPLQATAPTEANFALRLRVELPAQAAAAANLAKPLFDGAVAAFQTALKINPQQPKAQENLNALTKHRSAVN